ncbi:hypothetical protein L3X38_007970 [Prunus dulcis]|uniref:Uncharacterized protein n=1 Tax=Prunus dulcis TaxID=3755 RepID=A0AAD4ZVI6_PRUDU|nr:hypothetical protein L3X38_007970 [Prunus dulcis]
MGNSPPTKMGMRISRNLLNGDGFDDGGGYGERGRRWYCHTQPLPDPLPSLVSHGPKVVMETIDSYGCFMGTELESNNLVAIKHIFWLTL